MIPKVEVLIFAYPLNVDIGYQLCLVIKLDGFRIKRQWGGCLPRVRKSDTLDSSLLYA